MDSENPRDGDFELVTLRNGSARGAPPGPRRGDAPLGGPVAGGAAPLRGAAAAGRAPAQPGRAAASSTTWAWARPPTRWRRSPARASWAPSAGAPWSRAASRWTWRRCGSRWRTRRASPSSQPFREAAEALMRDGVWEGEGLRWRLLLRGCAGAAWTRALPPADLVFFDPFSPASNPDDVDRRRCCRGCATCCREDGEGALLLTYSAATPTRVTLLLAGFYVGAGRVHGDEGGDHRGGHAPRVAGAPAGGALAGAVASARRPARPTASRSRLSSRLGCSPIRSGRRLDEPRLTSHRLLGSSARGRCRPCRRRPRAPPPRGAPDQLHRAG